MDAAHDHQADAWIAGADDTPGYLWDGSPGDTATGYSATSYTQNGVNYSTLYVMLFSASSFAPNAASLTFQITGSASAASLALYCQDNTGAHAEYSSTSPVTGTVTASPSHNSGNWHWRASVQWAGAPGTLRITDMRFNSAGGAEIIPTGGGGSMLTPKGVLDNILTGTETRGAMKFAPRFVSDPLFLDFVTPIGVALGFRAVSDTLLSGSEARSILSLGPRVVSDPLFAEIITRKNVVAGTGGSTPPINAATDTLFAGTETRSAITFANRRVIDALFTDIASTSARVFGLRNITDTFFTAAETRSAISPAVNPSQPDNRDPFRFVNLFRVAFQGLRNSTVLDATLLKILDDWAAAYRATDAAFTANRLAAAAVDIVGGDGVSSTVYGTGSESFIATVGPANDAAALRAQPDNQNQGIFAPLFSSLNSWLNAYGGYSNLNNWLTGRRAANPSLGRVHPNTAKQYSLYNQNQGALLMTPDNVFAPQTNFGAATVGAAGAITFTDAANIPVVNVAGPPAVQGYTPPTGLKATVTTAINGTLVAQVTFNGLTSAGATVTGRTGTLTLSSLAVGATATMVPTVAGDRIADITAIIKTGSPTATAGAFSLDSVLERVIS